MKYRKIQQSKFGLPVTATGSTPLIVNSYMFTEQNEKVLFSLLELANKSMSINEKFCIMGDFNYPSIKCNGILTNVRDFDFS